MGCDGGTIPKRHELVRTKQKPEQKDGDMARTAKWKCCAITQNPLVQPIVSCEMGNLYNKEAILEYLLNKSSCDAIPHVRGLKDVKELKLTKNNGYNKKLGELADKYYDTQAANYICPVAGLEMNGKYPFGFIWSCGCVISQRAMKEVPSEVCHKCGKSFEQKDFILLNGEGEDLEKTKTQMEARRADAKLKKKAMKVKTETSTSTSTSKLCSTKPDTITNKSKRTHDVSLKKESKNESTTTKKSKIDQNGQLSKYKTVAEDPNASKVFKSLFTSSETAKNRPGYKKSNWVTYNPYHL